MYRNAVVPTYETILGLLVIGGPKKIEQVIDATLRHLEPGVEISQNKIPLSKDSYDGGEGMTGDEVDSTSEMDVDRRAKVISPRTFPVWVISEKDPFDKG
jgi:hypothetical protein